VEEAEGVVVEAVVDFHLAVAHHTHPHVQEDVALMQYAFKTVTQEWVQQLA
jgi:hypothetical protein